MTDMLVQLLVKSKYNLVYNGKPFSVFKSRVRKRCVQG